MMIHARRALLAVSVGSVLLFGAVLTKLYDPGRWNSIARYRSEVVPISFFAIVTDEAGRPINGASITFEINTFNPLYVFGADKPTTVKTLTKVTERDGMAQLSSVRGRSFSIKGIVASGYARYPDSRWDVDDPRWKLLTYYYSPKFGPSLIHTPNANRPIVFTLDGSNR